MHLQIHSQMHLQACDEVITHTVMSTISKVAERAGVSRTTVSHVINHADRVSKELRERVTAAIDELGYAPNPQAKSLRTGRTDMIAVLIPDIGNPFYTEIVKAAQDGLEKAGLEALVYNTDVPGGHWQTHGRDYLRQLTKKRVDGLIVGEFALHGMDDELARRDTPTVFIGHLPNNAVDNIHFDDYGGGYLLGEHLAKRGHTKVAEVTGPARTWARSRAPSTTGRGPSVTGTSSSRATWSPPAPPPGTPGPTTTTSWRPSASRRRPSTCTPARRRACR
jgi:DNA-binding LacI/PurR family transcriptional regulator